MENLSGKQNVPERSEQKRPSQTAAKPGEAAEDPWAETQVDWDDAFKELEELFTGKKSEPQREPDPEPVIEPHITSEPVRNPDEIQRNDSFERLRYSSASHRDPEPESPFRDMDYDSIGLDEEPADLVDDDNPIFQDVDEMTTVTVTETQGIDVSSDLKNTDIMRNAIIIKEVLDPPLSVRKSNRDGLMSQRR